MAERGADFEPSTEIGKQYLNEAEAVLASADDLIEANRLGGAVSEKIQSRLNYILGSYLMYRDDAENAKGLADHVASIVCHEIMAGLGKDRYGDDAKGYWEEFYQMRAGIGRAGSNTESDPRDNVISMSA